ncbi:MAG TPA: glycosyl hydrolase family 18 protein [Candidatus Angelobacter sp.]|nr:glycosyl hydrolase family 18 protein [Candidatus Angelobacter sp.]
MRLWHRGIILVTLGAFAPAILAQQKTHTSRAARHQVIGYFTEDGAKSGAYTVKSVVTSGAAAQLTELDYAFGRVSDDQCQIADREAALDHAYGTADSVDGSADPPGAQHLRGTFHQLQELKRLYPKLKVVISFGGWGQSDGFSSATQLRHLQDFVRSCVDTFIKGHFAPGIDAPGIFDGIDVDWEYPVEGGVTSGHPEDTVNFTAMAAEFRRQLDAVHPGLLLTAALPAEAELYKNFELKQISRYMDDLSIMAYDEHWSSEPLTNLHSALVHDPADPSKPPLDKHYGDYAVQGFLAAGVPKAKIVFGVPFYGKGWAGVKDVNHGLYQPASGPADAIGYRTLKAMQGADRQFYPKLATCTLWNQGNFWGYDCPEAMRMKMNYVRRHGLGGVMFWELSHDTADGELLRILGDQPCTLSPVTCTLSGHAH